MLFFYLRKFTVFDKGRDVPICDDQRGWTAQAVDEKEPQRSGKENRKQEKEVILEHESA